MTQEERQQIEKEIRQQVEQERLKKQRERAYEYYHKNKEHILQRRKMKRMANKLKEGNQSNDRH